jgi:hypothetical protein
MADQAEKTKGEFVDDVREGSVQFGIWRDEGSKGPYFKAKLSHSYFKEGQFHPTDFYGEQELINLATAALTALSNIRERKREERSDAENEQEAAAAA